MLGLFAVFAVSIFKAPSYSCSVERTYRPVLINRTKYAQPRRRIDELGSPRKTLALITHILLSITLSSGLLGSSSIAKELSPEQLLCFNDCEPKILIPAEQ